VGRVVVDRTRISGTPAEWNNGKVLEALVESVVVVKDQNETKKSALVREVDLHENEEIGIETETETEESADETEIVIEIETETETEIAVTEIRIVKSALKKRR